MKKYTAYLSSIFFILIPCSFYLWQSFYLQSWIIDDAGISFSYAKNLANGYGIKSWPGEKPVEGFSNFLWTIVVSILHLLQIFNPIYSPKFLSFILITLSFITIHKITTSIQIKNIWGMVMNLFIAINAPIVIWCNSGLENALYLFLLLVLLYKITVLNSIRKFDIVKISIICFLIAITRPEGIVYTIALPIIYLYNRKTQLIRPTTLLVYGLMFLSLYGSFIIFRWYYFGDLFPNPYHVKYYKIFIETNLYEKLNYLSYGIGGFWGKWLLILILLMIPFVKFENTMIKKAWRSILVLWTISFIQFFILPADWMGELRFVTIFIALCYIIIIMIIYSLALKYTHKSDVKKLILFGSLIGLFVYSSYHFTIRIKDFAINPTIPFSKVKSTFPDRYNLVNEALELKNATMLLPDVGATLYYSNIKVIDAAGLTNKDISKRLNNPSELRDYVFTELKPSIIHLHGRWKEMYNLSSDNRLAQEYYDVSLKIQGADDEFYPIITCDYIRKDLINESNKLAFDSLFNDCISISLGSPKY